MKLYESTADFDELYERFDEIDSWEPDTDEDGKPIDDNGNVCPNHVCHEPRPAFQFGLVLVDEQISFPIAMGLRRLHVPVEYRLYNQRIKKS